MSGVALPTAIQNLIFTLVTGFLPMLDQRAEIEKHADAANDPSHPDQKLVFQTDVVALYNTSVSTVGDFLVVINTEFPPSLSRG